MPQPEIEAFLEKFSEPVRDLASSLIDIVSTAATDAKMGVRVGWGCVAFTHPRVGYFAGVFVAESQVRVGFEFGVLLDDPARSLTGTGSQMRYLDVPFAKPVPAQYVAELVRQAIDLPPEASIRRMMVRELGSIT